jgi:membrane protein implicated in regulation of membrane protease activity
MGLNIRENNGFSWINCKIQSNSKGKIFVNGEMWRAVSDFSLSPGDRVAIQNVDGITLSVIPFKERGE